METLLGDLKNPVNASVEISTIPDLLFKLDKAMPPGGLGLDPKRISVAQVIVACERFEVAARLSRQLKQAVLQNWPSPPSVR